MTRGLPLAIAGCLVSGVAILVADGQTWARVAEPGVSRTATGTELVGSLTPWAVLALAGVVAVAATRRWGRLPVGMALAFTGAVVAWVAFDLVRDTELRAYKATPQAGTHVPIGWPVHETAWPYVTIAAGLLLLATGAYGGVRGPSWPALGARYDAPAKREDAWAALDRGEDPTA